MLALQIVSILTSSFQQSYFRTVEMTFDSHISLSKTVKMTFDLKIIGKILEPRHVFPPMWYFDKFRLRRACAASF